MENVARALAILELVVRCQPIGVAQLVQMTDLPKTTVHRTLESLSESGWIQRRSGETAKWEATNRVSRLFGDFLNGLDFQRTLRPLMIELNELTNETVHLAVLDHTQMVIVDRIDSSHLLRSAYPIGYTLPVYAASTGKAILASLDEAKLRKILPFIEFQRLTEKTLDQRQLLEQIDEIRRIGFAASTGEFRAEIHSVAVAFRDIKSNPICAISISAPASRMDGKRINELGKLISQRSHNLSLL